MIINSCDIFQQSNISTLTLTLYTPIIRYVNKTQRHKNKKNKIFNKTFISSPIQRQNNA